MSDRNRPTWQRYRILHRLQAVLLAIGLVVAVAVIGAYGFDDVAASIVSVGWGVLWLVLFHAVPLFADALGWLSLIGDTRRPGPFQIYLFRWVSEAVNNLLPVAQVGGEVVRVRLTEKSGLPTAESGASVIVDVTVGLFALMILGASGLFVFVDLIGADGQIGSIAVGVVIFTALIIGFFVAQRAGLVRVLGRLTAFVGRSLKSEGLESASSGSDRMHTAVQTIYAQPRRLVVCAAMRLTSFVVGAGEIWLGLYFLGETPGIAESIVLYSLTMVVRSAAFAIPGGLGAQEGGFLLVGTMLGLSPTTALALALLKRVREVLFGLPGLFVWWLLEARFFAQVPITKE